MSAGMVMLAGSRTQLEPDVLGVAGALGPVGAGELAVAPSVAAGWALFEQPAAAAAQMPAIAVTRARVLLFMSIPRGRR
jgi:hypothetical protein